MTPSDPELPRAVALAWGVAADPQRGPKRELTTEKIVDAAIEIADAGGLSAVSMAGIAASLGFTPMALYRYVSAKDDLVTLMQESGIGVPPEPVETDAGWRDGLRRWSREQVLVFHRHPWLIDIPVEGLPMTPNNLAWLDAGLALLADTPLDAHERTAVVLAVDAQTRWQGAIEVGYLRAAAARGTSPDDLDASGVAVLHALVTPENLPEVHAALHAGVFAPAGGDPFAFGLERVLDGVEHLIEQESGRGLPRRQEEPPEVLQDRQVREAVKRRRDAEKHLRDARKSEREAMKAARERLERA